MQKKKKNLSDKRKQREKSANDWKTALLKCPK